MSAARDLTTPQKEVLGYIESFIQTNGYPPTIREIMRAMGWRSTNAVNDVLRRLTELGRLEQRKRYTARGLRLVRADG